MKNYIFEDIRGSFTELYKRSDMDFLPSFKQVNMSVSEKDMVRGLHFQKHNPQGKLIRVLSGYVTDVAMDLRKGSPTYGQVDTFELKPDGISVYIPPGFAHGFWSKKDSTRFLYMCTEEWDKESDGGIDPSDASLGLPWGDLDRIGVSMKDLNLPKLKDFESPFEYQGE